MRYLIRIKCMAIPKIWFEIKWRIYKSRGTYDARLLVDFSLLSSGSQFKIHFSLEFRGNRGSSQNFHGAPFPRDRKIIIPNHATIPISYYTCSNMKFNTCMYKNIDTKNCFIHTKIQNKTTKQALIELSFFAVFCDFDKQKD